MGAGASAIPDKVSLEDARAIAGEKFDLEVFKTHCNQDGFVPRDILLQYDKKEIVHANTMPTSLTKKIVQDGKQLTQAESMRQLWRKATGGLGRPTSVKDLAVGFIITKRAAWADSYSSPLFSSPQANRKSKTAIDTASTPTTAHHKNFEDTLHENDILTPSAKHHTQPVESLVKRTSPDLMSSGHIFDESMDSNDSLFIGVREPSNITAQTTTKTIEKSKEDSNSTTAARKSSGFSHSLRLNLAVPLTLDLNAPPADRSGLTLMTDAAGVMRAGGKSSPSNSTSAVVALSDTKQKQTLTKRADSYGDLLDGVDGIIEVDELEGSFMMTPRADRGMTLNLNLESSQELEKSMMFTASGAIELKGVDLPIRDTGMIMTDTVNENHESNFNSTAKRAKPVVRLPLQDRAVRLERLGAGAAGVVFKAFDLEGLELVALKEIPIHEKVKRHQMVHELNSLYKNLQSSQEQAAALAKQEQADSVSGGGTMKEEVSSVSIGSQHVVAFIDAFSNLKDATVNLMVEYMNGGSLQNIVDAGGCDDHITLANIAKQSLLGLRFLHRTQNLHRDIKPANMLINFEGDVKISDFGIIRKLEHQVEDEDDDGMLDPGAKRKKTSQDEGEGRKLKSAHTFVGTVTFMSPERINGESYSTPSDVWSLGLSLMTCALGKIPLRTNKGYWSLLQCVRDEDPPCLPDDGRWSQDLIDFCKKSMVKDPAKRATCDELLAHPFLKLADSFSSGASSAANPTSSVTTNMPPPSTTKEEGGVNVAVATTSSSQESKEVEMNDDDVATPLRSVRPRSQSVEVAKDEIGYALREGAENELDALLRGLFSHVDGLFATKRQGCLSLLNEEASQAESALKALEILLRPDAQPRRKTRRSSSVVGCSTLPSSSNSSTCLDSLNNDCLDRLALQLNLPLSVVRNRVNLLTSQGPEALQRYPVKNNAGDGEGATRFLEESQSRDVLFDTLDSEGTSMNGSMSIDMNFPQLNLSASAMRSPN